VFAVLLEKPPYLLTFWTSVWGFIYSN
jgi:hypothetical protein